MFGKERSRLLNSRFGSFVSEETKLIFNLFLGKVFTTKAKENCEVTLLNNGNLPMLVHLTGIVAESGNKCFLSAVDITWRKQTELLLEQTRQNYAAFFNSTDEFLLFWTNEGTSFIPIVRLSTVSATHGKNFPETQSSWFTRPNAAMKPGVLLAKCYKGWLSFARFRLLQNRGFKYRSKQEFPKVLGMENLQFSELPRIFQKSNYQKKSFRKYLISILQHVV